MILIDTSIWIDFFKGLENEQVDKLNTIFELNIPFCITGQIYQEVLQGAKTEKDFNALREYFDTYEIQSPLDARESYLEAARIYFSCQRKGITVRSSVDCMIVQITKEHRFQLFHNDRDFDHIHKAIGGFEIY
jgi:predicted nucleic acid-binding protein